MNSKRTIVASMHLVESGPPHIPAYLSVLAPPARCKLERYGQRGRRDKAEQRGRYHLRSMRARTFNDVRACPLSGSSAGPHPQRTRQSTSTLRDLKSPILLAWKLTGAKMHPRPNPTLWIRVVFLRVSRISQ